MNLAVREPTKAPELATDSLRQSRQPSKVLPLLLQHLDTTRRLTILDLGRAIPDTIHFFAQYKCRIHVIDLYSELQAGLIDRDSNKITIQRHFQNLFKFESGTRLDLCLLWDLPHYLNEKQLRAFSSALYPWLEPKTRAHMFGVHSAATTLLNREYGIADSNTISIRKRSTEQLKNSPHPQSFLNEWLTCFSSTNGVLLPDGKVENLLQASV